LATAHLIYFRLPNRASRIALAPDFYSSL